jgi:hypothetical protein
MKEEIRGRLARQFDLDLVLGLLSDQMTGRDLQSLLLEVFGRRSAQVTPQRLLQCYQQDRFLPPARISPRRRAQIELAAYDHLPAEFEALELSPLAPLGCCSGLAVVHQNKVMATHRLQEVSADPSNVLALESALRRRSGQNAQLAACQRVVRAQPLPPGPGFSAHFSLFALASAGRASTSWEAHCLRQHLSFAVCFLKAILPGVPLSIRFTDLTGGHYERLFQEHGQIDGALCSLDPERSSGRNYYQGCCFKVWAGDQEVGDGGFVDWNQKLLSDARETLLISGLGMERLAAFGHDQ